MFPTISNIRSWYSVFLSAAVAISIAALAATPAQAQTTERVNIASDGTQGDGTSSHIGVRGVSADGRFVAFTSAATNLVPNDNNGTFDVFVRDRLTGTIELISFNSNATPPIVEAVGGQGGSISADGRYVAFTTQASIDPSDNNSGCNCIDVYVYDRVDKVHELISVNLGGGTGPFFTGPPNISADGRFVVFQSGRLDLVQNDTNGKNDIFVRDRTTGITELVSVSSDGTQGDKSSTGLATFSADGRYVAFTSNATNLVAGDTNDTLDVFVHDRMTGITERVSVANDGSQGRCDVPFPIPTPDPPPFSAGGAISADGRYVVFESRADSLVVGDTSCLRDVFVRDRQAGTTERVSVASDGTEANNEVGAGTISANGRYVAFLSFADTLVAGDTNGLIRDIFVHDRVTGATELVSVASDGTQGNDNSRGLALSADGQVLLFSSLATNLVPGDTNGVEDTFVRVRASTGPTQTGEDTTVIPTATDNTGSGIDPSLTTLSFDNVTTAGDTTITIDDEGAAPPGGLKLGDPPVVFNIETTATFDGAIEICIDYTTLSFGAENLLILTHFTDPDGAGPEPEQWVDITTVINTDFNIICGSVTSLSPFALMEPKDPVELLDGLSELVADLNSRQGIINGLDAKLDSALKARTDANENNNGAAVNAMQAFINATQAQSGDQIPAAEASELIGSAEEIIKVLSGDFF